MSHVIRSRARRVLALALALMMALALSWQAAAPAYADEKQEELKAEKDRLEQELNEIKEEREQNQQNLENAQAQKESLEQQSDVIKQQITVISNQRDAILAQISETEEAITAKQEEVDQKQAEFDERWAGFKERMASMQMLNDGGGIAILSSATNLFQLLTFSQAMADIAVKDQEVCQEIDTQKAELNEQKQELENTKADLETQEAEYKANEDELTQKTQELAYTIQQQDQTIDAAEAMELALASAESDKQAEFNKAAEEYDSYLRSIINNSASSNATLSCSLNFRCPLDSYKYISCEYGVGGHKGRDYAAPGGTPIHAVADGQVITVESHYSYGYYVMVYHGTADDGNNYTTLYAHMNSWPPVSVGQVVTKGDVIGYVGTTGNSTGNHLHIELRQNGARINPSIYIPS